MDYQKDIQKTEGLVKFLDSQSTKTNPFGENRVGERAYRRAERISAALFLLTAHVSDTEPLRTRARTAALKLLGDVLAVRDEMRATNSEHVSSLKTSVRELISLSRMLAIGGMISFQNATVLGEALDELSGFLSASQRSSLSETASYAREDFLDTREAVSPANKNQSFMNRELSDVPLIDKKDGGDMSVSTVNFDKTHDKGQIKNTHSGRSKAVLEVLRVGGELGIRDIASNLPEFSEKMVQRELADLVRKGTVVKKGLKRWSRYSIK